MDIEYTKEYLKKCSKEISETCEIMGWEKDWSRGGCYIHLEASEFIEALRGKGDPLEELGDVLFTILAVADYYNLDLIQALEIGRGKLKHIRNVEE